MFFPFKLPTNMHEINKIAIKTELKEKNSKQNKKKDSIVPKETVSQSTNQNVLKRSFFCCFECKLKATATATAKVRNYVLNRING